MVNTRAKGKRNLNKSLEYYRKKGWLAESVERASKYIKQKDLFNLFDGICIKPNRTKLFQVKSNKMKDSLQPFKDFAKKYPQFEVELHIWIDRNGVKIRRF